MKNVCIVGYGAIGPVHARALEKTDQGRLYGVCDMDPLRRRACSEQYGAAEYEDFDAVLRDDRIHSIHVCTPHYLHYEMIKKALAAGKDVVAEKPVTRTRQEWNALNSAEGADRICVVLQNRLNPCVQELKKLVQSGRLGAVRAAKGILTWSRDRAYYASGDWRGKWQTEGGGLLINQAIHTLDLFSYTVGDILSVRADMCNHTLEGVIEVEDTLAAHLELSPRSLSGDKSGEQGICEPGLCSGKEPDCRRSSVKGVFFATNGYEENSAPFFEILFDKGTARYMDNKLWVNGELTAEDVPATAGKDYWGSGHERLIKRFYDEGKYFTLSDAASTMEAMFAMYEDAGRRQQGADKADQL